MYKVLSVFNPYSHMFDEQFKRY